MLKDNPFILNAISLVKLFMFLFILHYSSETCPQLYISSETGSENIENKLYKCLIAFFILFVLQINIKKNDCSSFCSGRFLLVAWISEFGLDYSLFYIKDKFMPELFNSKFELIFVEFIEFTFM